MKLPADPKSENVTLTFDGNNPDRALSLRTGSDSPVFVNMRIGTRPALIPLEPENKGFGISRSYQKVQTDGTIVAADDLQVGDLILVTLDLNFPNERETYLAIDDALPAIFEAVNPNFKSQETQRVDTDRNARTFYTTFREIRKDRVLFFADSIYGAGDYNIQYLARVVAPGQVTAPPAKIEAMYEPQRFGLSGTEIIRAKAKQLDKGGLRGMTMGKKIWSRLGRLALVTALGYAILLYLVPLFFPLPEGLENAPPRGQLFLDREGKPIRRLLDGDLRADEPATFSEFPSSLIHATIAAEDSRFFSHNGIDYLGLLRATRDALLHRKFTSGASTITQQTIKLYSSPRRREIRTKLIEVFSARRLEIFEDKETILTAYLNHLPYGNQFTGVRAAYPSPSPLSSPVFRTNPAD